MVEGGEGGMVGLTYTIFYSHHALPAGRQRVAKMGDEQTWETKRKLMR